MEKITISKGDVGFNLNFTVQDSTATAYNIGSFTVAFKVWTVGNPGTLLLEQDCTEVVAADGTCYYTIQSGDFDTVGSFRAELELTKTGVIESTENFEIVVVRSG